LVDLARPVTANIFACFLSTVPVDDEEAESDNSVSTSTKWNFFEELKPWTSWT
jgi:hypothetical protein